MKSTIAKRYRCRVSSMVVATALGRLREIGPIFRAREAVSAGVSWRDLYRLRDEGSLIELSRGLYQLAEAAGVDDVDFIAVCARAPRGMICLHSALAYWDLSDGNPARVHLAVPKGSHRPAIDYPPTDVHVFADASFEAGRVEIVHGPRERFWITNRERTVVDAFRLRHLVGDTVAHEAMRRYLQARPDLGSLAGIGDAVGVGDGFNESIRLLTA
jgi:predicted transcriptional regulator of viral defense system